MILSFSTKIPSWIKMIFGNPANNVNSKEKENSIGQNVDLQSIHKGAAYISKSLMFLANKDVIASCRIHREFGKQKRPYFKTHNIYLSYLWEGAEKAIETARHISSNPNHTVDLDLKSEIKVLANSIAELGSICNGEQTDLIREKISKERDSVHNIIVVRSKIMKHEHFYDGTLEYSYLTLLYHLHSFLNVASKLNAFLDN